MGLCSDIQMNVEQFFCQFTDSFFPHNLMLQECYLIKSIPVG